MSANLFNIALGLPGQYPGNHEVDHYQEQPFDPLQAEALERLQELSASREQLVGLYLARKDFPLDTSSEPATPELLDYLEKLSYAARKVIDVAYELPSELPSPDVGALALCDVVRLEQGYRLSYASDLVTSRSGWWYAVKRSLLGTDPYLANVSLRMELSTSPAMHAWDVADEAHKVYSGKVAERVRQTKADHLSNKTVGSVIRNVVNQQVKIEWGEALATTPQRTSRIRRRAAPQLVSTQQPRLRGPKW